MLTPSDKLFGNCGCFHGSETAEKLVEHFVFFFSTVSNWLNMKLPSTCCYLTDLILLQTLLTYNSITRTCMRCFGFSQLFFFFLSFFVSLQTEMVLKGSGFVLENQLGRLITFVLICPTDDLLTQCVQTAHRRGFTYAGISAMQR